jgi:hypothetical protein
MKRSFRFSDFELEARAAFTLRANYRELNALDHQIASEANLVGGEHRQLKSEKGRQA